MSVDTSIVYAMILGGGVGTRLQPLTRDRAKPAVPIAGKYRLIDVPISNCLNSKIGKIFVLSQYNTRSLHQHVHETYAFDLFSDNFVEILAAEQTAGHEEWYQGNADAVRHNLRHLSDPDIDRVLILSGDQLYRMDFRNLLEVHEHKNAHLTLAATVRRLDQAEGLGILRVGRDLKAVDFIEKPTSAQLQECRIAGADLAQMGIKAEGDVVLASMGIYHFNRNRLELALDGEMEDFGRNVIPWCIEHMRVYVHPFEGYWEDVGTIGRFYRAHMALTGSDPAFVFDSPTAPMYTRPRFLPTSRYLGDSVVSDSIIGDGCVIDSAKIRNSVIGLRGNAGPGSALDHVIHLGHSGYESAQQTADMAGLPGRGIGAECRISHAIIDRNSRIGDGVQIVGRPGATHDSDGECYCIREGIVVIPKNAIVPDGKRIIVE